MSERISKANLAEIKFDKSNANKGSERGRYLIEASMREFGFADAGTLDINNVIIGGNKRTEVAGEIALSDEAIIIDVDGTKPVYIRRNDLNLSDPNDDRARKLAYALNRSSEVSLTWDTEQLLADMSAGLDLSSMFREDELDALLGTMTPPDDPNEHWQGMPEFEHEDLTAFRSLHIHFSSEEAVQDFASLIGQTITDKTKFVWHPKQEIRRYGEVHES